MPNQQNLATFNITDQATKDAVRTYTTFSGSDIKAAFNNIEIGNLQGISVSVNRETRPVFVMGKEDAVSFSRGKRGIAGSIILSTFDRHALGVVMMGAKVFSKHESLVNIETQQAALGADTASTAALLNRFEDAQNGTTPRYSDELPPFTITLVARNSFGHAMQMSVSGVILISEGMGISIDDATQESQLTFVCTSLKWWESID